MKYLSLLSGAMMLLAACNVENDTNTFNGKTYKLVNGLANNEVTIAFDAKEKRFYGNSGINRYFGNYTLDGNNLKLGETGSTMMAGPEDLMNAEQEFLQFLNKVQKYQLENNKLLLSSPDKTLEFTETEEE